MACRVRRVPVPRRTSSRASCSWTPPAPCKPGCALFSWQLLHGRRVEIRRVISATFCRPLRRAMLVSGLAVEAMSCVPPPLQACNLLCEPGQVIAWRQAGARKWQFCRSMSGAVWHIVGSVCDTIFSGPGQVNAWLDVDSPDWPRAPLLINGMPKVLHWPTSKKYSKDSYPALLPRQTRCHSIGGLCGCCSYVHGIALSNHS